jgi:hypothetical protein
VGADHLSDDNCIVLLAARRGTNLAERQPLAAKSLRQGDPGRSLPLSTPIFLSPGRNLQKPLNGAALTCVNLVVYWIDRWPSQS